MAAASQPHMHWRLTTSSKTTCHDCSTYSRRLTCCGMALLGSTGPRGRTGTQGGRRGRPARGTSASWRAPYQAFRHADLPIGPGRACIPHTARTASGTDTHQPACAAGCRHRRREAGVAGEPDELLTIEELIAELRGAALHLLPLGGEGARAPGDETAPRRRGHPPDPAAGVTARPPRRS